MADYELRIDGSSAEAGAERIVKSFESIKAAATSMEGGVVEAAKRMTAAFNQLTGLRTVPQEAVNSLTSLSKALNGFKGPTKISVDNTLLLLNGLKAAGTIRAPGGAGLANFLAATARYNGPTPQAGVNLQKLVTALNSMGRVAGVGPRVVSFLNALGGFRGPSANAGANLEKLFLALSTFKGVPRGLAGTSEQFIAFAAAVDRVTQSFTRLRQISGAQIQAPSTRGVSQLGGKVDTSGIRQFRQESDLLRNSLIHTQTAFRTLGGILGAKVIINAANDVLKIRAQLQAATGSSTQAANQFDYLQKTASRLGLEFTSLAESYGRFLGGVKGTGTTIADAQRIFSGFATAGRALQLSTSDMDGIFRALGQIMSKGKLQAEELRGQLGDRLPGAFSRMAAALGISTKELDAQMKKGLISGEKLHEGLLNLADSLQNEFAESAKTASATVDAAFNRLRNAFTFAASGLGESGLNKGLIDIADSITKLLQSEGLAVVLQGLGKLFKFVGDNVNFLVAALSGLAGAAGLKWATQAAVNLAGVSKLSEVGPAVREKAGAAKVATTDTFKTGYRQGYSGVVGPSPAVAATTAAAGSAGKEASGGMQAYADATNRAAAASASQATSATAAAGATTGAGTAAAAAAGQMTALNTVTAGGSSALTAFQASAQQSARMTQNLAGAVTTTANAAQNAVPGLISVGGQATKLRENFYGTTRSVTLARGELNSLGIVSNTASGTVGKLAGSMDTAVVSATKTGQAAMNAGTAMGGFGQNAGIVVSNLGAVSSAAEGAAVKTSNIASGVKTASGAFGSLGGATSIVTGGLGSFTAATQQAGQATIVAAAGANTASIGTRAMGVAAGVATGTVNLLRAALMSIPFVAIGIAISAVVGYLSSLKSESDLAQEALNGLNSTSSQGSQVTAAYTAYLDSSNATLDQHAIALRKAAAAQIELNLAKAGAVSYDAVYTPVKSGQKIPGTYTPRIGGALSQVNPLLGALGTIYDLATGAGKGGLRAARSGGSLMVGGQRLTGEPYQIYRQLTVAPKKGGTPTQLDPSSIRTEAQYKNVYESAARLRSFAMTSGAASDRQKAELLRTASNAETVLDSLASASRLDPNWKGPKFYEYQQKLIKGYNQAAGIKPPDADTGGTGGKGKGKSGGGAGAVDSNIEDIRRAMEAVRDLNREIFNSSAAIQALTSSRGDVVAQEAQAAAQAQFDNFKDAFNTAEKAEAGVKALSHSVQEQAGVTLASIQQAHDTLNQLSQLDPAALSEDQRKQLQDAQNIVGASSDAQIASLKEVRDAQNITYEQGEKVILDYLTATQRLNAEKKKEAEIVKQIAESEFERATKTGDTLVGTAVRGVSAKGVDLVTAALEGGRALREAQARQEAQVAAKGVNPENYQNRVDDLTREKMAVLDVADAIQASTDARSAEVEIMNLQAEASLYAHGAREQDIEDTLELIKLQRELREKGLNNVNINAEVAARTELIKTRREAEKSKEIFTKLQQVGQDFADAIVDGFREGAESGKSFLKTIGGIFKDLKKTILDFVLYNPLKQFLGQMFTGTLNNALNAGKTAVSSDTGQILSMNNPVQGVMGAGGFLAAATAGIPVLSSLFDSGNRNNNPVTYATGSPSLSRITSGLMSAAGSQIPDDNFGVQPIVVTATKPETPLNPLTTFNSATSYFEPLKRLFSSKRAVTDPKTGVTSMVSNFKTLTDGFKDIGSAFKGTAQTFGARLGALGKGLGKVAGVAGQAFAAFEVGSQIGKALGLGRVGSKVLGGAAAGAQFGPVGAAVGAVVGLGLGLLGHSKKPQAKGSITVGEDGRLKLGTITSKDKGDRQGVQDAADATSGFFTRVADQLGSYLRAGDYGTFGTAKKIKGDVKTFYSTTGAVDKKGRPKGTAGVDYLIGTPDELAAFALKTQINAGKFADLNPIYQTIAKNSTAKTADDLSQDLGVGKSYLDFVDLAKVTTQLEKQNQDLTKSYNSLLRQSKALGISTNDLTNAYNKMLKQQKDDFNFSISQGILGITDPIMGEYNQLIKDYQNSVRDANAVGGDLAEVERYYGLQRTELVKKYAEQATNSIKSAADDLLRQLTATDSSPLAPQTIFSNAQAAYGGLTSQIASGDYSHVDQLGQLSQDYLSAAQTLYSSSTDFFSVFTQVTDFLKYVSANAPADASGLATATNPEDLPALPSIAEIQQQILDANSAVVANTASTAAATAATTTATQDVGATLTETNVLLQQMLDSLAAQGIDPSTVNLSGSGFNPFDLSTIDWTGIY